MVVSCIVCSLLLREEIEVKMLRAQKKRLGNIAKVEYFKLIIYHTF